MTITVKTRKILWARSGNRCAICKLILIEESTPDDADAIVGDECHIHAQRPGGPRHKASLDRDSLDDYENLILLCRVHHKHVDDQCRTFSALRLQDLKRNHEQWVRSRLEPRKPREQSVKLTRFATGKDVADLLTAACHAYDFDHDPVETKEQAESVAGFLQNVRDWGDLWGELDPVQRANATLSLSTEVKGLERAGFLVFGANRDHVVKVNGKCVSLPTSVLRVLRENNIEIITQKTE